MCYFTCYGKFAFLEVMGNLKEYDQYSLEEHHTKYVQSSHLFGYEQDISQELKE